VKPTCPECGHDKLHVSYTCHTWPSGEYSDGTTRWMACQGCDSALRYWCWCSHDDEVPNPDDPSGLLIYREPECECQWDYEHGLNPDNPRAARNEEYRPPWLVGDLEFGQYGFAIAHREVEFL
jgi:hypothetical protein